MPRSIDHIPDLPGLAARMKYRREEVGLSQRQLAFPGCTAAYISRIEAGARTPSRQMIDRLAERLQTTRDWLETGDGPSDGTSASISVAVTTDEIETEMARWFAEGDPDAVTWASLDEDERGAVVDAIAEGARSRIGAVAGVIAINRKMRQEAVERLDQQLGDRLRQAVREEGVPC